MHRLAQDSQKRSDLVYIQIFGHDNRMYFLWYFLRKKVPKMPGKIIPPTIQAPTPAILPASQPISLNGA